MKDMRQMHTGCWREKVGYDIGSLASSQEKMFLLKNSMKHEKSILPWMFFTPRWTPIKSFWILPSRFSTHVLLRKRIGLNVKFMEAKMIRRKFILDCQNWKIQLSQEYIYSNFGSKLTKWPVRGIGEEKPDRGVRLD
jgi:hypothetical protein